MIPLCLFHLEIRYLYFLFKYFELILELTIFNSFFMFKYEFPFVELLSSLQQEDCKSCPELTNRQVSADKEK